MIDRRFVAGFLSLLAFAWSGLSCGEAPLPEQPAGFDAQLQLGTLEDLNPDPHVLEVELEAAVTPLEVVDGLTTPVWSYGGLLPGPLLRLTAGDRLIVRFHNNLPEPTTIHWHGVRLPIEMDGSPEHSQPLVQPGESFVYDFVVPDPGLYWYHPHEHSAAQLGFGLYGALLVDPSEEPAGLGDEVVMVLSDMGVGEAGALTDPAAGGNLATLFGREGGVLLVNGKRTPTLQARNGLRQRWRIVNAAKSRYFLLRLPGHSFQRIGGDTGLLESPEQLEELLIVPGQRVDVVVRPSGRAGDRLALSWVPYDRGFGSVEFREPETVLFIDIIGDMIPYAGPLPRLGEAIAPLSSEGATPVPIRLTQTNDKDGNVVMGINDVPFWDAEPIVAEVGETQLWMIDNEMEWAHPFHLHGFFFQAADEFGAPIVPIEWRDTIDIPEDGSARFLVRFENRPGMWMFHCHILDHADAGMMSMVDLRRP